MNILKFYLLKHVHKYYYMVGECPADGVKMYFVRYIMAEGACFYE